MNKNEIICGTCNSQEYRTAPSGPHLKAVCKKCGSFIKFIPKPFDTEKMNWDEQKIYFGKYKDRLFKDIAKEDPNYIRWMAENLYKKMKLIAEEAVFEFKL